jgi:DNA-binding GntR family transcriptional regulator
MGAVISPTDSQKSAYESIRELILATDIPPGTQMVERKLAEVIGMSRVPVREALQRLVLEGLLEHHPGKGLVTRTYDEQDILDLYVFREPLDGAAARLFASRADPAEHEYLRTLFEGMVEHYQQQMLSHIHDADFQFHRAIARGSRNRRLAGALDAVYLECLYVTRTYIRPQAQELPDEMRNAVRDSIVAEHRAVYDAIIGRDPEAAERAARESVRRGATRFLTEFGARSVRRPGGG